MSGSIFLFSGSMKTNSRVGAIRWQTTACVFAIALLAVPGLLRGAAAGDGLPMDAGVIARDLLLRPDRYLVIDRIAKNGRTVSKLSAVVGLSTASVGEPFRLTAGRVESFGLANPEIPDVSLAVARGGLAQKVLRNQETGRLSAGPREGSLFFELANRVMQDLAAGEDGAAGAARLSANVIADMFPRIRSTGEFEVVVTEERPSMAVTGQRRIRFAQAPFAYRLSEDQAVQCATEGIALFDRSVMWGYAMRTRISLTNGGDTKGYVRTQTVLRLDSDSMRPHPAFESSPEFLREMMRFQTPGEVVVGGSLPEAEEWSHVIGYSSLNAAVTSVMAEEATNPFALVAIFLGIHVIDSAWTFGANVGYDLAKMVQSTDDEPVVFNPFDGDVESPLSRFVYRNAARGYADAMADLGIIHREDAELYARVGGRLLEAPATVLLLKTSPEQVWGASRWMQGYSRWAAIHLGRLLNAQSQTLGILNAARDAVETCRDINSLLDAQWARRVYLSPERPHAKRIPAAVIHEPAPESGARLDWDRFPVPIAPSEREMWLKERGLHDVAFDRIVSRSSEFSSGLTEASAEERSSRALAELDLSRNYALAGNAPLATFHFGQAAALQPTAHEIQVETALDRLRRGRRDEAETILSRTLDAALRNDDQDSAAFVLEVLRKEDMRTPLSRHYRTRPPRTDADLAKAVLIGAVDRRWVANLSESEQTHLAHIVRSLVDGELEDPSSVHPRGEFIVSRGRELVPAQKVSERPRSRALTIQDLQPVASFSFMVALSDEFARADAYDRALEALSLAARHARGDQVNVLNGRKAAVHRLAGNTNEARRSLRLLLEAEGLQASALDKAIAEIESSLDSNDVEVIGVEIKNFRTWTTTSGNTTTTHWSYTLVTTVRTVSR